jgi:eukaryotic-like serine/threonine-protein kinase
MDSAAELVICPACRSRNLDDARFCSQCGIRLATDSIRQSRDEGVSSSEPLGAPSETTLVGDRPNFDELALADPLIGVVVAERYRILEPIGRGGMGVVYRVEHARIGKLMALKLLAGELSRDPDLIARFKREALMASKLSHPNTVQVFDFGTADGLTYLAMEYLRGHDLGRIIRQGGPLGADRTAKIVVQICSSLAEAHDHDIIHRDLKPENIVIVKGPAGDDVVKVLDFSLAKLRESKELGEVTTRGAIVGTPFYMSPEQIRGEPVDARSDIYSLGALMYACLTGQPVFDAPTPMGVLTKHLTEEPDPPSTRAPSLSIPRGLNAIVMRALSKQPEQRYQSVRELQQALVDELRGEDQTHSVEFLLDSQRMQRLAAADEEAATRSEVERYERKLRRRGQYAFAGFAAAFVLVGLGGWKLWRMDRAPAPFNGFESEPNNTAGEADPLPFGKEVRGEIGRRIDPGTSDRDFYKVTVPPSAHAVSLHLAALPNMALCLLVYRAGLDSPLGYYCSGSAGQDLTIDRLELDAGNYLLAVTQDREAYSDLPPPPVLENVSDVYRLRIQAANEAADTELEPNDALHDANLIAPGATLRGQFAWMRDVDNVCVRPKSGRVRFVVEDAINVPRPATAVLEVTPHGGSDDGIPVRIHGAGTNTHASPRDVSSPWTGPDVDVGSDPLSACLTLKLVVNPWASGPLPRVPPAGPQQYVIHVERR